MALAAWIIWGVHKVEVTPVVHFSVTQCVLAAQAGVDALTALVFYLLMLGRATDDGERQRAILSLILSVAFSLCVGQRETQQIHPQPPFRLAGDRADACC